MKIFKISTVLALLLILGISCDESELDQKVTEGGLIEVQNTSLNYVVGNPGPYTSNITIYQGDDKTTKIEIYKTFYSTRKDTLIKTLVKEDTTVYDTSMLTTILSSNTVLYETINISDEQTSYTSFDFTFDDLREGLVIESEEIPVVTDTVPYEIIKGYSVNDVGDNLPTADGDCTVGDYWEFEYHTTISDGRVVLQDKTTKATIATRYAGKYIVLQSIYFRIGVLESEALWNGDEIIIESIDAKTYRWADWGASYYPQWEANGGVGLYFQIENGNITYPASWNGVAQTINGNPLITCETDPLNLSNVCGSSNYVINDDVNKRDQLLMAHGYLTSGTTADGPREFDLIFIKKEE